MELNAENQPQAEDVARPENSEVEPVEQDTQSTPEAAEGQPEAKQEWVPLKQHVKERAKKRQAQTELEEAQQKIAALENEKALLEIVHEKPVPQEAAEEEDEYSLPPDRYDYDEHDQWVQATKEWLKNNDERLANKAQKLGREAYQQELEQQQQAENQRKFKKELEDRYEKYYDDADELGIPQEDFLSAEEAVKKHWPVEFMDFAVANIDNPHQLILSLGKEPEKAAEIIQTFRSNQILGTLALSNYANSINPINQKGDPLPEPDEPLKGGAGGVSLGSYEDELDKAREQFIAGQIDTNQLLAKKEALKAKYGAT